MTDQPTPIRPFAGRSPVVTHPTAAQADEVVELSGRVHVLEADLDALRERLVVEQEVGRTAVADNASLKAELRVVHESLASVEAFAARALCVLTHLWDQGTRFGEVPGEIIRDEVLQLMASTSPEDLARTVGGSE